MLISFRFIRISLYLYLSIFLSIHSILMRTILESIYEKYLNWEFTHWYIDVYHYLTVTISITKMILWGYSELSKAKICILKKRVLFWYKHFMCDIWFLVKVMLVNITKTDLAEPKVLYPREDPSWSMYLGVP